MPVPSLAGLREIGIAWWASKRANGFAAERQAAGFDLARSAPLMGMARCVQLPVRKA